jgi:protein-tyrosine phosphatase
MFIPFSNQAFLDHGRALYYSSQKDLSNGVLHAPIEDHLTPTLEDLWLGVKFPI